MNHWPEYTTPNEKPYAIKHVQLLERTLSLCKNFRTAIQAGGNIGYWPKRMAIDFERVITFEPEPLMFACLEKNLEGFSNIEVRKEALGAKEGKCGIIRRGFGSHRIDEAGLEVDMVTIDSLELDDVDLIQLDIEGYEINALVGAIKTIKICKPLIQVEILNDHQEIFGFMTLNGYRFIENVGRDYFFEHMVGA